MADTKKTRKDPVSGYVSTIEKFLEKVGYNPADVRLDVSEKGNYGWRAHKGSASILIFLLGSQETKVLRVVSPILKLPQENLLPFYRRLLETNLTIPGCSLGVKGDEVVVFSERVLTGLRASEIEMAIDMVASVADGIDDELSKEFGATML